MRGRAGIRRRDRRPFPSLSPQLPGCRPARHGPRPRHQRSIASRQSAHAGSVCREPLALGLLELNLSVTPRLLRASLLNIVPPSSRTNRSSTRNDTQTAYRVTCTLEPLRLYDPNPSGCCGRPDRAPGVIHTQQMTQPPAISLKAQSPRNLPARASPTASRPRTTPATRAAGPPMLTTQVFTSPTASIWKSAARLSISAPLRLTTAPPTSPLVSSPPPPRRRWCRSLIQHATLPPVFLAPVAPRKAART